ncbi:MAG: hypothetical protein QOI78_7846 [Actinomycetota bacterium]|jgi:hypothetical protein|nr:hypothetical protein [Actinomycetota bacterium]
MGALYAQPGGGTLGFCPGGYLAGATPGSGLLPGDTEGAIVDPDEDTVVKVRWRGRARRPSGMGTPTAGSGRLCCGTATTSWTR